MSHTPGPWEVKYSGAGYVSSCMIGNGLDDIASMNPFRKTFNEDAHLIAAAPELLEACEALLTECAIVKENSSYATVQITKSAMDDARAAIRKARAE